ncbi:MAG: TonB-dependent receptor [Planctomycetota bacterium]
MDIALAQPTGTAEGNESDTIEELVVVATREEKPALEVPASVTVQSVAELRQKGFVVGTDEFRGVPGVFVRRGGGDNDEFPSIAIRGVTGNHGNDTFLAMIDGVPFIGADEEVLLYELPYDVVDSVEVVRGPVSALYGRGGIAGAVNYRTRPLSSDRTEVAFSAGNEGFARGEAHIERAFDNGAGILLSANYEDFEGWRDNSEREIKSVFLKGTLPIGDRGLLNGYVSYYDRFSEVPSVIPTLADGTIVDFPLGDEGYIGFAPTLNDVEGFITALRYEHSVSETLGFQLTGQVRNFDREGRLNFYSVSAFDPDTTTAGFNGFGTESDTTVYYTEAVVNWSAGNHTIVAGISAERAEMDKAESFSGAIGFGCPGNPFGFSFYQVLVDYSTGQVTNNTPANFCFVENDVSVDAEVTNTFYGAFIQDEIALTDNWTLTLGLRYDEFDRDVDFRFVSGGPSDQSVGGDADSITPKVSLSYNYGNGMVYGSYSEGFNSNFGPLFQWNPNEFSRVEKPTTLDNYEFGWKGRALDGRLEWETAVFFLEQRDRRVFVSNPDPLGTSQIATTGQRYESQGLEASLRFRPTERTSGRITYAYVDAEWDELILEGSFGAPDQDFSGATPTGVPENTLYVELQHQFTDWMTARLTYEWNDDYEVDLGNSVTEGSYDLLGLSATFIANENVTVDVAITNLLDEEYYFFFAGLDDTQASRVTPGVPRLARATLRWQF